MCFIETAISKNYFSEYLSALMVFKIKLVLLFSSKFYALSINVFIRANVFQTVIHSQGKFKLEKKKNQIRP